MPELPEVDSIRAYLKENISGKRIKTVLINLPRLVKNMDSREFAARLAECVIVEVQRRGKYLLFSLDSGDALIVHLRMTGRLVYGATIENIHDAYGRISFYFSDGTAMVYSDTRTLGALYLVEDLDHTGIHGLDTLGIEPLSNRFTAAYLTTVLSGKNKNIKSFLLDQQYIAGLGNIYVDETLFASGISPFRTAASLLPAEIKKLHLAIRKVLRSSLAHGGTTFRDYRNGAGGKGSNQLYLTVYGRGNEPCLKCGKPLRYCRVVGRGTHYCIYCQR